MCISSAPTERISMQVDTGSFYDQMAKIGQNINTLHEDIVRLIFTGDIMCPKKRSLAVKWHQTVRVAEEV